MAVLDIVTYPAKSLSEPSVQIDEIDDSIKKLADDMIDTMYDAPGVGLAAPQVGVNKRMIVCVVPSEKEESSETEEEEQEESVEEKKARGEHMVLVNPKIVSQKGKITFEDEGCLSVPDFRADVKRAESVVVEAQNIDGEDITIEAEGLFGVILQHEIDHLEGVLFIDRISSLKRDMYKKRVKKHLKSA